MKKYSLLLSLFLIPYYAFAVTVDGYPNLDFTINNDRVTCSVSRLDTEIEEAIIPSEVTINSKTYNVTSIKNQAFFRCTSLTSVEIPSSVTTIGEVAFSGCTSLTSVEIPSSVTSIGEVAFSGCTSLTSVEIPSSVTSIGNSAFSGCSSLTSVEIPSSVTSIGEGVFSHCTSLTSVEIPSSVASIGNSAFYYCTSLTSVVIPSLVTTIGNNVFFGCSSLTSVEIPSSVTSIGEMAFYDCYRLTSVEIPSSVTTIGDNAFYDCSSLTSVEIPSLVTSIGNGAFGNCSQLKSLIFRGDTCPSIGTNAFNWVIGTFYVPEAYKEAYISGLAVDVDSNSVKGYVPESAREDLVFTPIIGRTGECSVKGKSSDITGAGGELDIPSTILTKDGNIYNVTTIGNNAFWCCSLLTSVEIPSSVTSIGNSAFYRCSSLTSVEIPSSVTTIRDRAFYGCSSLTSVEIPSSVTTIGNSAFYGCSSLMSVEIPSSVTTIGSTAFADCTSLTSVEIPSSVTTIVDNAFSNCTSLTSVEIPSSVTTIGNSAFYGCSSLMSVEIPSSVTTIGSTAFADCTSLTLVEIPSSVTTIGNKAFGGCSSLASVEIPSSVTTIGNSAFSNCSSLTSVVIPSSVTSIGNEAFSDCTSLTSVGIPSSVTTIGHNAFANCTSLTSVEIPSSVTTIGDNAFYGCSQLKSLIFTGDTCTFIGTDAFHGVIGMFYVPEASVSYYESVLDEAGVEPSSVKGYVPENAREDLVFTPIIGRTGECSVKGKSSDITGAGDELDIPSAFLAEDGNIYNVTVIENNAFQSYSFTSIILPEGLTSIGDWAFAWCSSLTSVEIPSSVTTIGSTAFYDCYRLTSVEIPSSVTTIGSSAFYGCSSLTSVGIPSSVTSIGSSAFAYCYQLQSLIFAGDTCPSIDTNALNGVGGAVYVLNENLVAAFKEKFPSNEVKPLLDIADYVKTGDEIAVSYPEGYEPKDFIYSVTEGTFTITGNVITGHGEATVKVADAENENIYAETTLKVYVSGDSNDNGTVDITDAVNTANYIVGKNPESFLVIAANVVDPDKSEITVADVVATVDIMLDAPAAEPSEAPKALYAPANTTDYLTFRADAEGIALSLAGEGVFSALQTDVTLPAGTVLNGVSAGDRLTASHSVMYRMVDDRTVRVAVFALSLDSFVPGDAVVILDVKGMGAGEVTACNVIASDADGHGYRLGVDGGGMTGVEGVVPGEGAVVRASGDGITVDGAQGMTVEVYGVDGRLVRRITAGDDRVTVDVAPGVYAVRVGAAPAVKIAVR